MDTIRFATIGRSGITERFLEALAETEGVEYVGTYSRDEKSARDFGARYGARLFFDDLDALAASDEIDAVYIATPNGLHAGQAMPEMDVLCDPRKVRRDPREAYLRLKRSSSLTRRQLSVAREVCAWREESAATRDLPRKWVASDEVIVEVCKRMPTSVDRLRRIRGTEQLSERDGARIVRAVETGTSVPPDMFPSIGNVIVADTSFHYNIPEKAYRYALPRDVVDKLHIRKYGAHGTSHRFIWRATDKFTGGQTHKLVSCHLGSGASLAAIQDGKDMAPRSSSASLAPARPRFPLR